MIFGLCGTHGTGKSTILTGVQAAGYEVDTSQISRSAQTALGWDRLSRAQESSENMWRLQEAILCAMYDRDARLHAQTQPVLVERTPVDVLAYTQMWCERLGIHARDPRLLEYSGRARAMMNNYEQYLMVPIDDAVPFEEQANRADLRSRELVANNISVLLQDALHAPYVFTTSAPQSRIDEATTVLAWHRSRLCIVQD